MGKHPCSRLTKSSIAGAQSPRMHCQVFFQIFLYLHVWAPTPTSQVQGRDKKHKKGLCSTQQKSVSQGRGKAPPRAKTRMGPRPVPRQDRLAQSKRVQWDQAAKTELPALTDEPNLTFIRQTWRDKDGHTHSHTHSLCSHTQICLTPTTFPSRSFDNSAPSALWCWGSAQRQVNVLSLERYGIR